MEPTEGTGPLGAENLLGVPTLNDCYDDDEEVRATLKPRFSPLPRRRSSVSSDDAEAEGPSSVARKVSFADAFGLDLVSVKEFDMWDVPTTAQSDTSEGPVAPVEEFSLSPLFELASGEEARRNLRAQKVLLDSVELLPGSASMRGVIRVLNVCYEKSVYVRMSLDDWLSYYDILAEYVPDSCDGETDQFSFRMSMVPPYQKDGARVEFCIRYQTAAGTFWANNGGRNYALLCRKMGGLQEAEKQLEEAAENLKKSCLKMSQSKEDNPLKINEAETWTHSNPPDTAIPEIVYPPEDDDAEEIDETIDPKAMQLGRHNERELELLLSQQLIRIRDTPADQRSLNASGHSNFSRDEQRDEEELTHEETSTALHTLSCPHGTFSKDSSEQEGQLPFNDNQSPENFASRPSKEEETTDPASNISPYLQHAVVRPGEDMSETDNIQTMYVTEDLTNLQGITLVDITKGRAESESRLVDIVTISEEPYRVRQEAISSGRGASEPIAEGLDGNANPLHHLETENAVIKRDSLQGASLDQTDGESLDMGKALIAVTGLGAVVPQSVSSCRDSVETLEHEMVEKAGDVLGNDNIKWGQSVSDVPLVCAIREEECTCQSDTYYSNVHSELQEQDKEERAHAQSFLINGQQDLSTVNTLPKTEENLMNTCGADETLANESYTSMPTSMPEAYESGQETASSDTLSPWNGGQSELSDFWGEDNRMDPCPFSSTVTDHPLGYHDSVVTVGDAFSSISILQKAEDQAASGLETSGPLQCQNGASSENLHFDKEDDQESLKASTHTESTNETMVYNASFTKADSQWSIETSDSEHTGSQIEGVAEMTAFSVQDEGQWTAEPKDRESHNVCVVTNIGFGKEDTQSAIELSASKHIERRDEGVAENLSFVEEGIQNISTSAPEQVEGHYEGPKASVFFAEMYSQKAPETSVSEYLESQKDILEENPSFAKEEIQETFETLAPEYTEGQNECMSEMIASSPEALPWNIETSEPVPAEGQCDAIGQNVSLAKEGYQTSLETTALEHLGSQDESMAENKTFIEEDSLNNIGTSAPEQIEGHNEGANENVYSAEMYSQKAPETSVSEYLESQKEILSENLSFVKEEIQETFETLAPEYTEGQNECMSEMIATSPEALPWNIETSAPVPAEGQCDAIGQNVSLAKEGYQTSRETTALEHLGSQDESMAENKTFIEEDSLNNIATSAPEQIEGHNEGAKVSLYFAEMYSQKAPETSVSEYLESQKEILSENLSFVKEDIQETFETLAPEYTEGQHKCMSEMIASSPEALPWTIETSAPVHAEGQCDVMVESVPVVKEGNQTSLETTALEHLGSQDESMAENKTFTEEDSRKNIGTSAPEHRESPHEGEESKLQSELYPFQFESEESHYVMWDESNSDLLEDPTAYIPKMQSTEREHVRNEMDTGTEDTESLGMWVENPSCLLVDPTEELLISQEIISSHGYILSDYSMEEEALLIETPVEDILETPPVGESTIIFEDMNEEAKKEGTTEEEVISSEDQEANIGRSLDTRNDKPSMRRGTIEEIQERIEASIGGTLQRDSLSGDRVPQEPTECYIRSIPPIQDRAWPVDTEQVMFQEELYIEEAPGEPDMVGEPLPSEVNYSVSIESDMKPPSHDFSTALVGGSDPTGADWEDHSSSPSASSTISDANTCVGSSYSLTALCEDRDTLSIIQTNVSFKEPDSYPPAYSFDMEETGKDRYVQHPDTTLKKSQSPEVFISEATSERRKGVSERDKEMAPKTMFQLQGDEQQECHRDLHSDATSQPKSDESVAASESLILKRVSYKVFYFLVFVVFAVIIHQYDLTICFVLYFVSLYLLFWERGARKEPVKKE
ncbi:protein phosphatase 1 regulatory subunit 3A [Ambystoma mexicanum]|uniref:protein phosphatase 1 regulatory subunit 3A n=1 Tax=Ambystoma mexicanum TaxID=8296 RepID=UPI0037E937E3